MQISSQTSSALKHNWIVRKSDLILLTGANGFVGSKVFEILIEYGFYNIRCLVRSERNIARLRQIAEASSLD